MCDGCSRTCWAIVIGVLIAFGVGFGIGFPVGRSTKRIEQANPCDPSQPIEITTRTTPRTTIKVSPSTDSTSTIILPSRRTTPKPSSPPPIPSCPFVLSPTATSVVVESISSTTLWSGFRRYSIEYQAPLHKTGAMLKFEFVGVTGTWYLDDVSIRNQANPVEELIINGGFENGNLDFPWEHCHAVHAWYGGYVTNKTAHRGTYCFASTDFSYGTSEYLTQKIDITGGINYVIDFYLSYAGEVVSTKVTIDSH